RCGKSPRSRKPRKNAVWLEDGDFLSVLIFEAKKRRTMLTAIRPPLHPIPVSSVWPPRRGLAYATMSMSQWDGILQAAYDAGFVLIELDDEERPVAAYRLRSVVRAEERN